ARISAGLVFRRGVAPHASFQFKHALVQDTAYAALLREPRRDLHARIAKALAEGTPGVPEAPAEILAHHYTEAGMPAEAARYWGRAGLRSMERSALVEATAQLGRALQQIAAAPTSPTLAGEQIT